MSELETGAEGAVEAQGSLHLPASSGGRRIGPFLVDREIVRGPGATLHAAADQDGTPRRLLVVVLRAAVDEADKEARTAEEKRLARATAALIGQPGTEVHAHGGADGPDGTRQLFWALPFEPGRPLSREGPADIAHLLRLARELAADLADRHARAGTAPMLCEHFVQLDEGGSPQALALPIDLDPAWLAPGEGPLRRAPEEADGVSRRSGDVWRLGRLLEAVGAAVTLPTDAGRVLEALVREDPARRPATGAEVLGDLDGLLASAPDLMGVSAPAEDASAFAAEEITQSRTPGDPLSVSSWSAAWTEVDANPLPAVQAEMPSMVDPDAPTRAETAQDPSGPQGPTDPAVSAADAGGWSRAPTDPEAVPTARPARSEPAAEPNTQLERAATPEPAVSSALDGPDVTTAEARPAAADAADDDHDVPEIDAAAVQLVEGPEDDAPAEAGPAVEPPPAAAETRSDGAPLTVSPSEARDDLEATAPSSEAIVEVPPEETPAPDAEAAPEPAAEAAPEPAAEAAPEPGADEISDTPVTSAVVARATEPAENDEADQRALEAIAAGWDQPVLPSGESPWSEVLSPRGAHHRAPAEFPGIEETLPGGRPTPARPASAETPAPKADDEPLEAALEAAAMTGFDPWKLAGAGLAALAILGLFALIARSGGGAAPEPVVDVAHAANTFALTSEPSGAQVVAAADGRTLGKTPMSFLVPPEAPARVFLAAPGYEPMGLDLRDRGGVQVRLDPVVADGCAVTVESPEGIEIEGVGRPASVGRLEVPGVVLVRAKDGQAQAGAALVRCPDRGGAPVARLGFGARRRTARVRVIEPAGAAAYVNGEPVGRVPASGQSDRAFVEVRVDDAEGRSEARWVPARGPLEVRMPAPRARPRPRLLVPDAPPRDGPAAEVARPANPKVARLVRLGERSLKRGRTKTARRRFRECLRLAPDTPACHLGLADAYAKRGRDKRARRYYEQYLQLRPDATDAPRVRAFLAGAK